MNPSKVNRAQVRELTDLPNVGQSIADDLRLLGYQNPGQIGDACPLEMYDRLCVQTGIRHDPCLLDVFMSITDFLGGQEPRTWWNFTKTRKALLASSRGSGGSPTSQPGNAGAQNVAVGHGPNAQATRSRVKPKTRSR